MNFEQYSTQDELGEDDVKTIETSDFYKKEFLLLECLMSKRTMVVSRATLLEYVWGVNADPLTNSVETHVLNLRTKLGDKDKSLIHTVAGL